MLMVDGLTQGKDFYLFHGSNVLRPQLQFKDPVDNSHKPWIPLPYRRGEIPMPSDTAATGGQTYSCFH